MLGESSALDKSGIIRADARDKRVPDAQLFKLMSLGWETLKTVKLFSH